MSDGTRHGRSGIMLPMIRSAVCVFLFPIGLLVFGQTREQNDAHVKEWTERRAGYLSHPEIEETEIWLKITENSPRPLDDVLTALATQHGWHINYEDPRYAEADLVDSTAASWLEKHPEGRHVHTIAGGAFFVQIPLDGLFPMDPMQIIPAVVDAYNHSGNPGRFELRTTVQGSFDIVPTSAANGPQKPILDTLMSFDATETVSAPKSLEKFCDELTRASGETVVLVLPPSANRYLQARIQQHSQNQPAREILREMYKQVGSTDRWGLLYAPDTDRFYLQFRW
jgi:hypothetical protein